MEPKDYWDVAPLLWLILTVVKFLHWLVNPNGS